MTDLSGRIGGWLYHQPYLLLAITYFTWGVNLVIGRYAVGHIPPMALTWLRWGLAFLIVLPFAWPHLKRDWPAIRSRPVLMTALAVIGTTGFNAIVYWALHHTQSINAMLRALAIPLGDRAIGGAYGSTNLHTGEGRNADGTPWFSAAELEAQYGAWGATDAGDGNNHCGLAMLNMIMPSAEEIEPRVPALILDREYVADTAGPGRHRARLDVALQLRQSPFGFLQRQIVLARVNRAHQLVAAHFELGAAHFKLRGQQRHLILRHDQHLGVVAQAGLARLALEMQQIAERRARHHVLAHRHLDVADARRLQAEQAAAGGGNAHGAAAIAAMGQRHDARRDRGAAAAAGAA